MIFTFGLLDTFSIYVYVCIYSPVHVFLKEKKAEIRTNCLYTPVIGFLSSVSGKRSKTT